MFWGDRLVVLVWKAWERDLMAVFCCFVLLKHRKLVVIPGAQTLKGVRVCGLRILGSQCSVWTAPPPSCGCCPQPLLPLLQSELCVRAGLGETSLRREECKQQRLLSSSWPRTVLPELKAGEGPDKSQSRLAAFPASLTETSECCVNSSLSVLQLCNQNLQILLTLLFLHLNSWLYGLVTKSCPTLATPWTVACQAPLSIEILQARILEWVAISFSSWLYIESKN